MQSGPARPPISSGGETSIQARQEYYEQSRAGWQHAGQQQSQPPTTGPVGSYSPKNRALPTAIYGQQTGQGQPQDGPYEYQAQPEQQASNDAASMIHQQEQRGVSQLQNAVSVATGGVGRQSMMPLPQGNHTPGPSQPLNSLATLGASSVIQGAQGDACKRGPVEFNHAISYVNKIKVSIPLLR